MNCAEHGEICSAHQVESYPTLVLYPGEKKYTGVENAGELLEWVRNEARSAAAYAADPLANQPLPLQTQHKPADVGAAAHDLKPPRHRVPSSHPAADAAMLKLRPMMYPIPVEDVIVAARYSLENDVLAALSAAPSHVYARPKLGALRAWLHVLHRALPQGHDGGGAATGASELLSSLHARTTLPSPQEWKTMLSRSGIDAWPSAWLACNSTHAELHAYPCSLWLLFHSLIAHATEPDALPNLHAVVGYVTNFFSCKECAGHFAVLAAGLEQNIIEMASQHHHGRDRAVLWLWQAHNRVNERLAAEALSDSPASQYLEFAKIQWPSRTLCQDCREVSRPHAGVKAQVHWRHEAVLKQIYAHYCLEPRFECWSELTRMGTGQRPATEVNAVFGTYGVAAGFAMLLLLACGCLRGCSGGQSAMGGSNRKKVDHVV